MHFRKLSTTHPSMRPDPPTWRRHLRLIHPNCCYCRCYRCYTTLFQHFALQNPGWSSILGGCGRCCEVSLLIGSPFCRALMYTSIFKYLLYFGSSWSEGSSSLCDSKLWFDPIEDRWVLTVSLEGACSSCSFGIPMRSTLRHLV